MVLKSRQSYKKQMKHTNKMSYFANFRMLNRLILQFSFAKNRLILQFL